MAESQSKEVYFLNQVANQKYNKDFAVNMVQLNNTVKSLSKYLIVMQKGIDDLNRDIIEVIRDFIEEVIIIFNGGDLSSLDFEWGDLKYVLQAIGAFFGFPIWNGTGTAWNPVQMAQNFAENFLGDLKAKFDELLLALKGEYTGSDVFLKGIQAVTTPIRIILDPMGMLKSNLIPKIGFGQISGEKYNLVEEFGFSTSETVDGGQSGFVHDDTEGRTAPGCALVSADGDVHHLTAVRTIAVSKDEELESGGFCRWDGAVGSPGGARILLDTYLGDSSVSTVVVGTFNANGTQSWTEGKTTWTVPSGIDRVAIRLEVNSAVAEGDIRFDDIFLYKVQKIKMDWVKNLVKRFENLAALFGITDTNLDGVVDATDVWNTLWHNFLKALNWIPNVAQETIDNIFNGFANLGELIDPGRSITDVIDTIAGLLGMNLSTQSKVSTMEAELRLLKSQGNSLFDNFERASSNSLGSNWGLFHSWSGGSGSMGTNGKGDQVWKTSGGSTRGLFHRHLTSGSPSQITTDSCEVSCVLASDPPDAGSPGAFTYLGFSVSNSGTVTYGRLRIGRSKVALEKVVGGTVTVIAESGTVNPRAGQTWKLRRGDAGGTNLNRYYISRDGTEVWSYTDGGSSIPSGSGYRGLGIGMQASSREIVPIFLYEQWLPAALSVVTYSEVL